MQKLDDIPEQKATWQDLRRPDPVNRPLGFLEPGREFPACQYRERV